MIGRSREQQQMNEDRVEYELRPATMGDLDLIREIKFSGLRPYVEEIWGWDPEEQEQRFLANFSLDQHQIIRHDGLDVGVLQMKERERVFSSESQ